MTIQQLRILGYLAECGSISRTAEICYLSQSALTRQLRSMEEELGYPLFSRSFSGIQLTPAGEAFCKSTRSLLTEYDKAVRLGRNACQNREQHVVRTGIYSNSLGFVVAMLKDCEAHLPHVHFRYMASRMVDNVVNLKEKRLDLCFPAEQPDRENGYAFTRLLTSRNCMRIPMGNSLYGKQNVSFENLYGQTVLLMAEGKACNCDRLRAHIAAHHPQIRIAEYDNPIEAEAEALSRGYILMGLGLFEPKKGFSFAILSDFPSVVLGAQYRHEDEPLIAPIVDAMRAYLTRQQLEPFLSLYREDGKE